MKNRTVFSRNTYRLIDKEAGISLFSKPFLTALDISRIFGITRQYSYKVATDLEWVVLSTRPKLWETASVKETYQLLLDKNIPEG